MNMYFSKSVVDALFCCMCGLASWWVHPLKLTKKYVLPSKYVLIVIKGNSSTIRSQNSECRQSIKKVQKSAKGCEKKKK